VDDDGGLRPNVGKGLGIEVEHAEFWVFATLMVMPDRCNAGNVCGTVRLCQENK